MDILWTFVDILWAFYGHFTGVVHRLGEL